MSSNPEIEIKNTKKTVNPHGRNQTGKGDLRIEVPHAPGNPCGSRKDKGELIKEMANPHGEIEKRGGQDQPKNANRGILKHTGNNPKNRAGPKTTVRFQTKTQRKKKARSKRGKGNKETNIKILYVNVNGVKSKVESLQSAAQTHNSHIVAITETKGLPPKLEGYTQWETKQTHRRGGGVAITVREELANNFQILEDMEDENQEILWAQITQKNKKIYIGVYYGKQENVKREIIEREFSQLKTQINRLKNHGPMIIVGDFNAKLEIHKGEINQDVSRNGMYLTDLLETCDATAISTESQTGTWTRVNRKNTREKSVIDYIIIRQCDTQCVTENVVDEAGALRIKGVHETDHNTMTLSFRMPKEKQTKIIKRWKLSNREGWKEFNKQMRSIDESRLHDYEYFENVIKQTLENTIGSVKINVGNRKGAKEPENIKTLRQHKREMRKKLEKEIKEQSNSKQATLAEYIEAQKELRAKLEEHNKQQTRELIEKIKREGGVKSKTFWNTKKRLTGKGRKEYTTISEEGNEITDPEAAKEHIANFFENLYQAREGKPEHAEWTEEIEQSIQRISNLEAVKKDPDPITKEEVKKVISRLKSGKATGPDDIPNEVFKEADDHLIGRTTEVMNNIAQRKEIPPQWQEGSLIRLYKGKGKKGKCSNERGITLSSNVGKVFERIMNERMKPQINITENQAGGQKGKSTTDHIMLLQELIKEGKRQKKPVYIVFLDVTKAYDKAWLSAILYVMHKQGLEAPEWEIIKRLNENLTAKIQTKYGDTREIKIKDSIRQGGVLSVSQYALLMDEINKEITEEDLGIYLPSIEETIGCLLWMDDVILATLEPEKMQRMMDITDAVSGKYHIEFGAPKSNAMKIGGGKDRPIFKLGDMILEYCKKYKYLGLVQNDKNNMKDHIASMKGKVEGAYQTIMAIAGNRQFKGIEMKAIWELIESTVIAIITYGCETWNANKGETQEINRMMDNIIRRILLTPQTTPREALYIETGLLDPQTIAMKQRINMDHRLKNGTSSRLSRLAQAEGTYTWKELTDQYKTLAQVDENDLVGEPNTVKKKVKSKILQYFKGKINSDSTDKSKVRHLLEGKIDWNAGIRPKYMNELSRERASTIFKARTRMIDVKNNFRNKYNDLSCRACGVEDETQEHVLESCPVIHLSGDSKVRRSDVFEEDPEELKTTARKIREVLDKITEYCSP